MLTGMTSSLVELLRKAERRRSLPPPAERRRLRVLAGVSQEDLASVLRVDRATVSRWEAGILTPKDDRLLEYTLVLEELRRVMAGS